MLIRGFEIFKVNGLEGLEFMILLKSQNKQMIKTSKPMSKPNPIMIGDHLTSWCLLDIH